MRPPVLLRHLRSLRRVSSRARADLVRAQIALFLARLTIRFRKRGTLLALQREHQGAEPATPIEPNLSRARELAAAVRRAADHGLIGATCLPRALATHRLLQHEGLRGARVRVGVRKRHGVISAHAWVEYAGTDLVDSELELAELREIEDLAVRPSS